MIEAKQFAISDTGERNMRAMRVHELSENVDVLRMDEVKLPAPGPGEVRLRLKACSVNFPDILMVQGKYQFKPCPLYTSLSPRDRQKSRTLSPAR